MLALDIPVGAGTDATRVASYNPWVALYWLSTGKTVGGLSLYRERECLDRHEALRLFTQGSSWFSNETGKKGALAPGQLADFIALTDDYFTVAAEDIKRIESVLTVVGGRIVHASDNFASHAPWSLPVLPAWSPLAAFGGYGAPLDARRAARAGVPMPRVVNANPCSHRHTGDFFGSGCDCFAF